MSSRSDLSIFDRFNFEYAPVGVKFSAVKPAGLEQLKGKAAFCEMLRIAQTSDPFYATVENHECKAGPLLLGSIDPDPVFESGEIGPKLQIFENSSANRRLYYQVTRLDRGTVNTVSFSSLHKLTFQPDLLILTTKPSQAEIVLRANGYKTGAGWNAKGTPVMGCSWLYLYPYVHGEINIMITGLQHGMKAMNLFPEGLIFISVPFDKLPGLVDSLETMEWDLPSYHWGKELHNSKMREFTDEVRQELNSINS